jgi:adenosylhomocysteine nucleosidase
MSAPKIAIVAALPGELRPLIAGWQRSVLKHGNRRYRVFQHGRTFAICGGMGAEPARDAAQALIEHAHPDLLISAGWAGSLRPELKVGALVVPELVIDAADGRAFRTFAGAGTLVTSAGVMDPSAKSALAARHSAQAVDMEAAAVAEVAQETTTRFLAVKSIFDEPGFPLPPLDRFRTARGKFCYGGFLAWVAVHPGRWSSVAAMKRNAHSSAQALCRFLEKLIASDSLVEVQQQIARLALGVPL